MRGQTTVGSVIENRKGVAMGKGLGGRIIQEVAEGVGEFRGLVSGWKNRKAIARNRRFCAERGSQHIRTAFFLKEKGLANWTEEERKEFKQIMGDIKNSKELGDMEQTPKTAGITKTISAIGYASTTAVAGYAIGKFEARVQVTESGSGRPRCARTASKCWRRSLRRKMRLASTMGGRRANLSKTPWMGARKCLRLRQEASRIRAEHSGSRKTRAERKHGHCGRRHSETRRILLLLPLPLLLSLSLEVPVTQTNLHLRRWSDEVTLAIPPAIPPAKISQRSPDEVLAAARRVPRKRFPERIEAEGCVVAEQEFGGAVVKNAVFRRVRFSCGFFGARFGCTFSECSLEGVPGECGPRRNLV